MTARNGSVETVIESVRRVGELDNLAKAEIFLTFPELGSYSFDPYTFSRLFDDFWLNAKEGSKVTVFIQAGSIYGVMWSSKL